jgi:hypothetical protein
VAEHDRLEVPKHGLWVNQFLRGDLCFQLDDEHDSEHTGLERQQRQRHGRNSDGTPKNKPSNSTSDALWDGYIDYVKGLSGSYNKKYGYRTLMSYLEQHRYDPSVSEDLWRTPHYPYHAVKGGTSLFLDFLSDLDFGDEVGLVAYGEWAVQQKTHNDGEVSIDITDDPITSEYDIIDTMQLRHQAGEYNGWTAMGDGIKKARELLVGTGGTDNGYVRDGAQPTMLVMTDGMTNQKPAGWTLPSSFKWKDWTDYDGDGVANYTTTDSYKKYAFYQASEAIKKGIVIHTLAVGNDAPELDEGHRLRRRRRVYQRAGRRRRVHGSRSVTGVRADRRKGAASEARLR